MVFFKFDFAWKAVVGIRIIILGCALFNVCGAIVIENIQISGGIN